MYSTVLYVHVQVSEVTGLYTCTCNCRCKESLKESTDLINNELQGLPLQLKFDGLSSFGSRVLYVNLSEGRDTIKSVSGMCICTTVYTVYIRVFHKY